MTDVLSVKALNKVVEVGQPTYVANANECFLLQFATAPVDGSSYPVSLPIWINRPPSSSSYAAWPKVAQPVVRMLRELKYGKRKRIYLQVLYDDS